MSTSDADRIPVLAALKDKDRERVLRDARRRTWGAGDVVVREGDDSLNLFLVVRGHASVVSGASGRVATLGPGDFFGELGIVEQHARTASVVADDELECILLPAWEFRSLLETHPEMAVPMLHTLIRRLHGLSPHEH